MKTIRQKLEMSLIYWLEHKSSLSKYYYKSFMLSKKEVDPGIDKRTGMIYDMVKYKEFLSSLDEDSFISLYEKILQHSAKQY